MNMNINIKSIFLVLTIFTLLLAISTISASDDNTTITDTLNVAKNTSNDVMLEESTTCDENIQDTRTIEKTDNKIKKDSMTIDDVEYTNVIENQNISTEVHINENTYINNCSIEMDLWNPIINNATTTINNSMINCIINNSLDSKLYIRNSNYSGTLNNNASTLLTNTTVNMTLNNAGNLIINDNCNFGDDFLIRGNAGNIIINDTTKLIPYYSSYNTNYIIENRIIKNNRFNHANLILINCQVETGFTNDANLTMINCSISSIDNQGGNVYLNNTHIKNQLSNRFSDYCNITLTDDVTFGSSFSLSGNGNYFTNNSNIIYPYLSSFSGNNHLSNMTINKSITNKVSSNLTLTNVTLNNRITNNGILIIDDDCVYDSNFQLVNNGILIINDSNKIYPYINEFNQENQLSNLVINKSITNKGELTLKNVTINNTITNNGTLIIDDDCIFTKNADIRDYGEIIINDTNRIIPYISVYNDDYTIADTTIDSIKTNNGNLTIINSTLTERFNNNGRLTVDNCLLNTNIYNEGTLIIDDDSEFGDKLVIDGMGIIITNNTDEITPYLNIYNGNYTIRDLTLTDNKKNIGNLTIMDSTLDNRFENTGNMTIIGTQLNGRINNNGILNITNDCTFADELEISGTGQIICDDIGEILPYLKSINQTATLEDMIIDTNITNYGNLSIISSTLESTITNNGILNISSDCILTETFKILGNGQVITDDITRLMPYLNSINGNYLIENMNITKEFNTYGNIEFINCNITSKITNYENLTLTDCSLSNNILNTKTDKQDGFLINNLGNLSLTGCIMENNTFNTTYTNNYGTLRLYGAMVNNGNMSIENSYFNNNKLGYYFAESYNNYYGNSFGNASVVYNNGFLTINNSNFTNNYAGSYGGAIVSVKNLTIDNSNFNDNTAIIGGGAIGLDKSQAVITNTNFSRNYATLKLTINELCGGGAIYATNGEMTIDNCIFDDNQAICYLTGLAGINSRGGSLALMNMKSNITNSIFKNHQAEVIQGGYLYGSKNMNATISNCLFENNKGGIKDYTNINIINNTFMNTTGEEVINNLRTISVNKTISGNKFIDNNVTTETINTYIYYDNTIMNLIEEDNTYQNTSINDTLELNIPDEIYEGQDITITGTYTITNPENYDSNILEQNKFNLYINGELKEILDELSFTVTPTSGTMIISLQPTISQTRKTVSISSTTHSDITITPDNYDDYIYDGTLIGVSKGKIATFTGQFNNKGEIYVDTSGIILNGEDATFTNTIFTLDADNITLRNMIIINRQTDYPISNYGTSNTINNNTITITTYNGKIAAIKNIASNTTISNNILTVSGPANTIDFAETSEADTQAILLLGGDNNKIINNTITVGCSGINTIYGTIEGITNSEGATNTLITQNKINVTGANFNYGINCLVNDENLTITENTMIISGERYCDGVQVGNGVKNILITDNNITCICINTTVLDTEGAITYGVIATNMGSSQSENITINRNNINITGTANYAIELYKVDYTQIHDNNMTVNGPFSLGIAYSYSPNGNATGNTITISGDSNTPINYITEEVKPENTGIRIQNGTQNIYIENNTIKTSDIGLNDTTIHSDESNITIKNNKLSSSNKTGDASLKVPFNSIVINNTSPDEGNQPEEDESQYTTVIITPQNIDQYMYYPVFTFKEYTKAVFVGTFTKDNDGTGYMLQTNNLIVDGSNATFKDICFNIEKTNVTMRNMNITISDKFSFALSISGTNTSNIRIVNCSLTINNTKTIDDTFASWGLTYPLYSHAIETNAYDGITIEKNVINVYGPSIDPIKYQNIMMTNTAAIVVINDYRLPNTSNININNNIINIQNTTIPTENSLINTIVTINAENLTIINNIINITGANTLTPINNTNNSGTYKEENNTIIQEEEAKNTTLKVDTISFTAGQTTIITASIYYGDDILTNITTGKITFKVNGKTLKDENGKVIYAKVVNGVATIENYLVPTDWAKEGTTIQAIYSGSTQCEKLTSEKTNITVEKAAPTLTTETVTGSAGSTVQLKATITDGDKVINSGKVVFKINGKTVKDTNGKVIYAKVLNNQVIINYTLPADMKAKDYNITATFISSDYERLEDTKVLSVTA